MERLYGIVADIIVVLHFGIILFEIVGQILVLVGNRKGWRWIRNFWFRGLHAGIIAIVVVEAWFGIDCPLTVWEYWFRQWAGQPVGRDEFITRWTRRLLGVETPLWLLTIVYTVWCAFVFWSWWKVPPQMPWHGKVRTANDDSLIRIPRAAS
jgi:hypothetical protein